jgi:hypothetical protein
LNSIPVYVGDIQYLEMESNWGDVDGSWEFFRPRKWNWRDKTIETLEPIQETFDRQLLGIRLWMGWFLKFLVLIDHFIQIIFEGGDVSRRFGNIENLLINR